MKIHIITIFPESFESYFSTSIMAKAINQKKVELFFYKLNDFSKLPTKRVDDKSYWMHWQIISPEPLADCIDYILKNIWKKVKILFFSPWWELLNQEKIEFFYENLENEFIVICGHYEWIDKRIIDLYVDYEISIWEYVISSWELACMVFLDSLIRNIDWVLWNKQSLEEDSFSKKLNRQKEYPQYTRPKIFKWIEVPDILISWNHNEINKWKNNNLKLT